MNISCLVLQIVYFRGMRSVLAISLFILLFLQANAQRYSFLQRGVEDGLYSPVVNDLERDPSGIIWLATDGGGLVKFDGENFSPFLLNDGLPSLFTTCIFKDRDDNFWIGTEKGIAFYNGLELTTFPAGPEGRINGFAQLGEGIWIASRNGLFEYAEGRFRQHDAKLQGDVYSVSTRDDALCYATSEGAFMEVEKIGLKYDFSEVKKIIELPQGQLVCFPNKAIHLFSDSVFEIPIPGIRDAVQSDRGVLWLASQRNGLIRVANGEVEEIGANNGLAYDRVRTLLLDEEKLWIGSQQGLSFLQNPSAFTLDASQGLMDESIHAAIRVENDYWLGTATGVTQVKDNGEVVHFGAEKGVPGGIVLDLVHHQNKIWLATEQGIAFLKNGKFYTANPDLGFDADFTFCLHTDSNMLTIGTATGSLFTQKGDRYGRIPFVDSVLDGIVQIISGHQQEIHVGISGNLYENTLQGLRRLTSWHQYNIDTLNVFAVATSPKYECLLVNGDGIYLATAMNKIRHISGVHGLRSLNFKSAQFVGDRLWITTDEGLQFVDIDFNGKSIYEVGSFSGISSINYREFNTRSLSCTADGWVLNGSQNGLLVFESGYSKINRLPDLSIQEVSLFFRQQTEWEKYAKNVQSWTNHPEGLSLPYDKNYLSFRFNVSPADVYDEEVFVRFKLEGQDDVWTFAKGRRDAIFTSINPGSYTFVVEASRTSNFREISQASFSFKIIPPFWKTWWFVALIVLIVGGATILFVRMRIKQLNEKLFLKTALADSERKSLRLQMNPHFVFNALDAISGFIFKNEPKEAVRYLGSFAKLMRLTLESSREQLVPLQSEVQLLKNYIDLEQLRFNHKFTYDLKVAEDVDLFETMLPPMLIQPFVENAIKHGLKHKKETDGKLIIEFKSRNNQLVCVVQDNGIGRAKSAEINASSKKQSLATSITEERIELLTRSLGARVELEVIDLFDNEKNAAGTKVVIIFPHLPDEDFS